MRELKFKEHSHNYTLEVEHKIKLKQFYTLAEKTAIYTDMLSKPDSFNRDFSLIVLTARFCTNIDFTDITDNEVYDIVAELLLIEEFKTKIDEYLDMYKLIEREESTYKLIGTFLETISTKLDGFDMKQIQDGFKGLKDVLPNGRL